MTRDSHSWILVALGAWLMSLASDPAKLERLIECDRQAIIAAICELLAIAGAFLKASPLPISDAGREKYQTDTFRAKR